MEIFRHSTKSTFEYKRKIQCTFLFDWARGRKLFEISRWWRDKRVRTGRCLRTNETEKEVQWANVYRKVTEFFIYSKIEKVKSFYQSEKSWHMSSVLNDKICVLWWFCWFCLIESGRRFTFTPCRSWSWSLYGR